MIFVESINFKRIIEKNDIKLFFVFSLAFIFIYGAMFTKIGYNPDELDTIGSIYLHTYRASGRWFHALWRWAIGKEPCVIAQGLTACFLFSISLIVLTKSLHIKDNIIKLVFGLIYLAQIQFAYVMDYVYQADTVAFGLFCVACSSCFIQKSGVRNYFYSIAFLIVSLAIYQSLILNFCIIVMVLIYHTVNATTWRDSRILLVKSISCCLLSLILYYCISKLVIFCVYTKPEIVSYLEEYRTGFNVAAKIGISDFATLYQAAVSTIKYLIKTLIYPKLYMGEWFYVLGYIPIFCLMSDIIKKNTSAIKKISLFFILAGIWIMPFLLILVFLNPNAMGAHNRLGEPLSLACVWLLAFPVIRWNRYKGALFVLFLAFFIVKASNYVNKYTNSRRYVFEAQLAAYKQMEFEAVEKASEVNIPIVPENILLYCFHKESNTYISYDPLRHYPALTFLSPQSKLSEKAHQEVLKKMAYWPCKNSIIVHDGKILIKCDTSCFIDSRSSNWRR